MDVKLKSTEFHVEAVLRTDLPKDCKVQISIENVCLTMNFLPRQHADSYNQDYREDVTFCSNSANKNEGKHSVVRIKSSCW